MKVLRSFDDLKRFSRFTEMLDAVIEQLQIPEGDEVHQIRREAEKLTIEQDEAAMRFLIARGPAGGGTEPWKV